MKIRYKDGSRTATGRHGLNLLFARCSHEKAEFVHAWKCANRDDVCLPPRSPCFGDRP